MRRVTEVVVWFVLLTGTYLVLVGPVTGTEAAVGVPVAATSAVLAVSARSAERLRDRPRARWLTWVPWVPAAVLADTGRLGGSLVGHLSGRAEPGAFTAIRLGPVGNQHRPAQCALAMLAISLAPGSYAVAADHERGVLTVHRLGRTTAAAARLDERVNR